MTSMFPALELRPRLPDDVLLPLDTITSRPRVWDEYGMPLDSYYADDLRPTRHPEDYAHVDPAIQYKEYIVQDDEGYGVNLGLMEYIRPHVPEMLDLVIDACQAFRTVQNIPQDAELSANDIFTVSFGLNSLWALVMYRTKHRIANGNLPVHVANLQRTFVGYESVLADLYDPDDPTSVMSLNNFVGFSVAGTRGDISTERCPAHPSTIKAGAIALQSPTNEARRTLASLLEQCESPRLLTNLHVDNMTFSNFAIAIRQLAETEDPKDLVPIQRLLTV